MTRDLLLALGAVALLAPAGCERQPGERREGQTAERRTETGQQPGQQQAMAEEKTASGTVVRASSEELVLRQQAGEPELRLKVSDDTSVTVGGQQAKISDLQEGTQVRAAYHERAGEQHAIRIEAQQPGGAQQPGTQQPGGAQQQEPGGTQQQQGGATGGSPQGR